MSARNGFPPHVIRLGQALTMLVLLVIGSTAFAQSDPPSRVGRVSDIAGDVFLSSEEADASWQPIGINYPVTVGDSVWVGQDGRAEIDFGTGQIRLSGDANVRFSELDERQFSAYLASGRAILHLRVLDPGETAKFDTANAQIDILRPGIYRLESTADGLYSRLVVRIGEAQLRVADRTTIVLAGQTAVIDGSGYGTAMAVRDGFGTDGFDAWSTDRDRRWETGSVSSRYVSAYVPGVGDLDSYGTWETSSTYGAVWYPRTVAADWVPYRDGRWTFVRPWGWTWVDSAPWGWAPFHYGRWVRQGYRWGWCPGELASRPVYAPALVAWYGGAAGTSWSINLGGPTFGWVPLAWGEPYWPHYRHSTDYWRVINRPYAVNVYRVPAKPMPSFAYANARIPGAVTAVSGEMFTGRQRIEGARYAVPVAALAGAALTTTPLALRPVTKPLAAEFLPRGIPAPAVALPGNSRQAVNPPASVGRPTISEPPPGVGRTPDGSLPSPGRPSISAPAPELTRPVIRDPVPLANDPRQSGGQVFTPPARPSPGARQEINEPAPGVRRQAAREPAPYSPGLSPAPQIVAPSPRSAPQSVREPAPSPRQVNPGLVPAMGSGQRSAPPPMPAAPVGREPSQFAAPPPAAAPGAIQGRPVPGEPAVRGRPVEPQNQMPAAPAPGPRSAAPTSGSFPDRSRAAAAAG